MKSNLKDFPAAYIQSGRLLYAGGPVRPEAIKQFEEGIQKDPEEQGQLSLSTKLKLYVSTPTGCSWLRPKNEEILRIDPKDPEARGLKATLSIDKGEYASAMSELESVVTARPQNYVAHFNLGRGSPRQGRSRAGAAGIR